MRTFTLVTDALVPVGRAKAGSAAARGKDLVLVGEMRSLLEALASELRVMHRVDVRVLPVDLADPDGAEQVLAWLDDRAIVLDGVVVVGWTDTEDEARAQQLEAQLEKLERILAGKLQQRGFGPPVRVVQERRASGTFEANPPSSPPEPRRRVSVHPPGSVPTAPVEPPSSRGRASTRPGHADPSQRPRSFTPVP